MSPHDALPLTLTSAPTERIVCGQCSHSNREIARYCGRCGVLLAKPSPVPPQSAQRPSPLSSGQLIGGGRYRVDCPLGGGSFSRVFLAEDTHLNRLCAIKQLWIDPKRTSSQVEAMIAAFASESRRIAALSAPGQRNLPDVYDHLDEQLCLVMKYVVGASLLEILARRLAPLPEDEALRYTRDACAALAYMHARTPPPPIRKINPAVRPKAEALVQRTLARAPSARPSAAELLAELEELLERRNIPPPEPEHPLTPPELVGRGTDLADLQLRLTTERAVALGGTQPFTLSVIDLRQLRDGVVGNLPTALNTMADKQSRQRPGEHRRAELHREARSRHSARLRLPTGNTAEVTL